MSLIALEQSAQEHGVTIPDHFKPDGTLQAAKGGDAIYFPKANCGAVIPAELESLYMLGRWRRPPLY